LWLAVGIHAGIVWAMLCYKNFAINDAAGSWSSFLGSTRGIDGPAVGIMFMLLIAYYGYSYWTFRKTLRY
ncbi:MAG TPA: hypothetical protein PLV25_06605, partial [Opitutales bacterium]|nr:hypothetical protein [Opitutales bacterium]